MATALMCRVARGTQRAVVEEGLAGPGARLGEAQEGPVLPGTREMEVGGEGRL